VAETCKAEKIVLFFKIVVLAAIVPFLYMLAEFWFSPCASSIIGT
jgi:hypothetical protein